MAFLRWEALALLMAAMAVPGQTQELPQAVPQGNVQVQPLTATQALPMKWVPVSGAATELAIDADGRVFALSREGDIWHWRPETSRWGHISGSMARISAGGHGRPWGIGPDGGVFRSTGLWWDRVGERGMALAADSDGNVWLVRTDNSLQHWNPLRSEWENFPGKARRIAVGADQRPWAVLPEGNIARWDGKRWVDMPGTAETIAVGPEGSVFMVTPARTLMRWNEAGGKWLAVDAPSGIIALAVGPEGKPWVATAEGIQASDFFETVQRQEKRTDRQAATTEPEGKRTRAADPALATTTDPIIFTNTGAIGGGLAIGAKGGVFMLDGAGNAFFWNAVLRGFQPFPGVFERLAVAPNGLPWAVDKQGRVLRHDGADWRPMDAAANIVDIAVGGDGSVFIAGNDEALYRFDPDRGSFARVPGLGVMVAVDPNGRPWTIRKDGTVLRCNSGDTCQPAPLKGKSIAIGPEGSVFSTSPDNQLRRWNAGRSAWDTIQVPPGFDAAQVAVGPQGRPWVVSQAGNVLASTFFQTNTVPLAQTAASAAASGIPQGGVKTTGTAMFTNSGDSGGFIFSKYLRFEQVTAPYVELGGFSSGPDGSVLVWGVGQNELARYIKSSHLLKVWEYSLPTLIDAAMTGPDGRLWFINGDTVYEQTGGSTYRTHSIPLRNSSGSGGNQQGGGVQSVVADLAVGPDGTVVVVSTTGELVYKTKSGAAFQRFNNQILAKKVALAHAGDLWIIDSDSVVRQWTGSAFENRPRNIRQKASDISAGANGTLFIVDDGNQLRKWNTGNQSFDRVEGIAATDVAVEGDGRPWILNTSTSMNVYRAR